MKLVRGFGLISYRSFTIQMFAAREVVPLGNPAHVHCGEGFPFSISWEIPYQDYKRPFQENCPAQPAACPQIY
jgi:hypothetical protein